MEQWIHLGRKLREPVNPSTMPVAVKFLEKSQGKETALGIDLESVFFQMNSSWFPRARFPIL